MPDILNHIEWSIVIAGLLGSLIHQIVENGKLRLPRIMNGELELGFVGGLALGATAGYLIDGSFATAFMGGYMGRGLIEKIVSSETANISLIPRAKAEKPTEKQLTIEEQIRKIATEENVDADLAVRVAKAESGLDPAATNRNKTGTIDRGLYQINNYWHPEVTDAQAFDIEFSTRFFCKAVKNGNLSWWDASKKDWEK